MILGDAVLLAILAVSLFVLWWFRRVHGGRQATSWQLECFDGKPTPRVFWRFVDQLHHRCNKGEPQDEALVQLHLCNTMRDKDWATVARIDYLQTRFEACTDVPFILEQALLEATAIIRSGASPQVLQILIRRKYALSFEAFTREMTDAMLEVWSSGQHACNDAFYPNTTGYDKECQSWVAADDPELRERVVQSLRDVFRDLITGGGRWSAHGAQAPSALQVPWQGQQTVGSHVAHAIMYDNWQTQLQKLRGVPGLGGEGLLAQEVLQDVHMAFAHLVPKPADFDSYAVTYNAVLRKRFDVFQHIDSIIVFMLLQGKCCYITWLFVCSWYLVVRS